VCGNSQIIIPLEDTKSVGLPHSIEERSQTEELLSKTVFTYDNHGQVIQTDHYDSEDNYHHSETYEYDLRGRLTSSTDPLDRITTYSYDSNHNLIAHKTPVHPYTTTHTYDNFNRVTHTQKKQLFNNLRV